MACKAWVDGIRVRGGKTVIAYIIYNEKEEEIARGMKHFKDSKQAPHMAEYKALSYCLERIEKLRLRCDMLYVSAKSIIEHIQFNYIYNNATQHMYEPLRKDVLSLLKKIKLPTERIQWKSRKENKAHTLTRIAMK